MSYSKVQQFALAHNVNPILCWQAISTKKVQLIFDQNKWNLVKKKIKKLQHVISMFL